MRKWSILFCLIGLGFSASELRAITPLELAQQAQQNYENEKFSQAIQDWKTLHEIGFHNGDIYYNLASAYWRLGEVGESRLYFLKAQKLMPRDPIIHRALDMVEVPFEKSWEVTGPMSLLQKIPFYRVSLNFSESLWLSALCSLLFSIFLFLLIFQKRKYWMIGVLILTLPFLGSLFEVSRNVQQTVFSPHAVILNPKVPLLKAPTIDASSEEELSEGDLLKIKKMQGDFALVRTRGGQEGWVDKKAIGEI